MFVAGFFFFFCAAYPARRPRGSVPAPSGRGSSTLWTAPGAQPPMLHTTRSPRANRRGGDGGRRRGLGARRRSSPQSRPRSRLRDRLRDRRRPRSRDRLRDRLRRWRSRDRDRDRERRQRSRPPIYFSPKMCCFSTRFFGSAARAPAFHA